MDSDALWRVVVFLIVAAIVIVKMIKKSAKTGDFGENLAATKESFLKSEMLDMPCKIRISRLASFAGAIRKAYVFLNGTQVGVLKNGESIDLTTSYQDNVLVVADEPDGSDRTMKPFRFSANSGGNVNIKFYLWKQIEFS